MFYLGVGFFLALRSHETGGRGATGEHMRCCWPLMRIERAAGEERAGPLLANPRFNQRG